MWTIGFVVGAVMAKLVLGWPWSLIMVLAGSLGRSWKVVVGVALATTLSEAVLANLGFSLTDGRGWISSTSQLAAALLAGLLGVALRKLIGKIRGVVRSKS